jgi:hypothetical protein
MFCVYFTPFGDNNGGNPYHDAKCDINPNDINFSYTIMGAGMESSEGSDR